MRTEAFRLVTTLLDHEQAPARQLAELYHQRWEIELGYGELKTRLRGPEVVLRSRSPQLIRQEVFAFLVVYQALCCLRLRAAQAARTDPDRISFTVTLRLARDQVPSQAGATPTALHDALEQTIADLLDELLPARRSRSYERKKRPMKNTFQFRKLSQPRPPRRSPTRSPSPATTPTWANMLSNRHCPRGRLGTPHCQAVMIAFGAVRHGSVTPLRWAFEL